MQLIFITNKIDLAKHAQDAGIDRIMVDLEFLGKVERQGHLDTLISRHSLADVARLRSGLDSSDLDVRCNPIHPDSRAEIETILDLGADRIMLPMFKSRAEVDIFLELVAGRAKTCLLLETPQALARMDEILSAPGINEVHLGLNDLHLAMGLDFMFELLSGGIVEYGLKKIRNNGLIAGFGGISRVGTGLLDASLVISEHVRLGSQVAILSRAFHGGATTVSEMKKTLNLHDEIKKIRDIVQTLKQVSPEALEANRLQTIACVRDIVSTRQSSKERNT